MSLVELKEFNNSWNYLLQQHKHEYFHTPQFISLMNEAFGDVRLVCIQDEYEIIKIALPLAFVKSMILGSKLISAPYIEYGGPVGDMAYLPLLLKELERKYGKRYAHLEIRGENKTLEKDMKKVDLYKKFELPLSSEEEIWKGIQRSKRKAINKSKKHLQVHKLKEKDIDEYYKLYCKNMKAFGSPPYSKKYFQSFFKHMVASDMGKVYGAYYEGKLCAALLGFIYRKKVHILLAVSDPKFREYRPNDAVHWTFIDWALKNEYKVFDFGRVREESGQFEFKRKWGAELKELPSYFMLWKGGKIPSLDPHDKKMKLATKVWKKLPAPIARVFGMRLRKELGI